MELIVWLVVSYLIGSIPSGVIVAKVLGGRDPRGVGSGNIGATNVSRSLGKKAGLITLGLDVLKGFLPTFLATVALESQWGAPAVGLAAFMGHLFPLYLGFKGGKGIATGAGVFLAVLPLGLAGALVLFALFFWQTRFVALASIASSMALPVMAGLLEAGRPIVALATCIAVMAVFKHKDNIKRLATGTEPRFGDPVEDDRILPAEEAPDDDADDE
jgi:glycerol-3-phosphate acyltransferase PlsY